MTKRRSQTTDTTNTEEKSDRIPRRVFLEGAAGLLVAAGIAASGLQSANATQKASKEAVSYQDSPNAGNSCSGCKFFDGTGACEVVEGDISANAWCSAWTAT